MSLPSGRISDRLQLSELGVSRQSRAIAIVGLGLSISYRIITEGHGGRLYCLSVPGKETEFVIELPIRENAPMTKMTREIPFSQFLRSQPSQFLQ